MRNRLGIILLTVVVTLLSLFYLSFAWKARQIESSADDFARNDVGQIDLLKRQRYLDSLWNQPVHFGTFSYKEVKENALNLGLDLQGGMHVTLEVSPNEIIQALAGNNDNPDIQKALSVATQRQRDSQDGFLDLFFDALQEQAPGTPLAEYFANTGTQGRIDFSSSDQQVIDLVRDEVDDAVDRAFQIIRSRIDKFGVASPNIQRLEGTGRIQLELPGVDNPARVRKLIQGVAKLEFLEVYQGQEISEFLTKANDYWVKRNKANMPAVTPDATQAPADDLIAEEEPAQDELFDDADATETIADSTDIAADLSSEVSPIFSKLRDQSSLLYESTDTAEISAIFNDPSVKNLLPADLALVWSFKPTFEGEGNAYYTLHPVKRSRRNSMTGDVVTDANETFDQMGRPAVSMRMDVTGAREWKMMTGRNVGRQIAIVLDDFVYTAPTVQGEIPTGSSEITGSFTIEEARDLANVLKAGKLPAPTRIVEEAVVGPSLGIKAQNQGLDIYRCWFGVGSIVHDRLLRSWWFDCHCRTYIEHLLHIRDFGSAWRIINAAGYCRYRVNHRYVD